MTDNNENAVISHRDAKLADLREDLAALDAKREKLVAKIEAVEREGANEAAIESLKAGDPVAYIYGRALNKRVLSGIVRFAGKNDKGLVQLKVESGEGLDAEFHLIDASALLFSPDEVAAAKQEIADAIAAAEAAKTAATQEGAK